VKGLAKKPIGFFLTLSKKVIAGKNARRVRLKRDGRRESEDPG